MLPQRGILFRFIVKNSSGNESQMSKRNKQADELKGAIAGLEAQRSLLGDTVVEPSLAALRQKLSQLETSPVDAWNSNDSAGAKLR